MHPEPRKNGFSRLNFFRYPGPLHLLVRLHSVINKLSMMIGKPLDELSGRYRDLHHE